MCTKNKAAFPSRQVIALAVRKWGLISHNEKDVNVRSYLSCNLVKHVWDFTTQYTPRFWRRMKFRVGWMNVLKIDWTRCANTGEKRVTASSIVQRNLVMNFRSGRFEAAMMTLHFKSTVWATNHQFPTLKNYSVRVMNFHVQKWGARVGRQEARMIFVTNIFCCAFWGHLVGGSRSCVKLSFQPQPEIYHQI